MNRINLTITQVQVIRLLLENPNIQFSIRQIARSLKKSYTLTYHNVQDLCKRDILRKADHPPSQIISLHEHIPVEVLIRIEQGRAYDFLERNTWLKLYFNDVSKASPHPFFVLLVFGSYAKGTQTKRSDIDLLAIVPREDDIRKFEVAANQFTKLKRNIITITGDSFTEMIQNPKIFNVGNEAKQHHIVLYNAETYYQLLARVT